MSLLAFGVNHNTAPVEVRERMSFAPERLASAVRDLHGCPGVAEAAILSTCNRTDLYCELADGDGEAALDWFRGYHSLQPAEFQRYIYTHRSASVVRYLIRVASGLDSMILGEPQILGQVKAAYQTARDSGTIGHILDRLFQHTFSVAKQVRTDTAIGASPVSVAFAAVTLAKQIFGDLSAYTALLVGAGETIELAARHLHRNGLGRMVVANRTLENAHRLAAQFDGYAIALHELPAHLADADIVISSTASEQPIVRREHAEKAIRARKHRPVFMVDIAVPRDIEPQVGDLPDVYLYTVDDLEQVIEENLQSRREAARQAEEIIDAEVEHLMGWLRTLEVVSAIRAYREQAETTRDAVLQRAQRMLAANKDPAEVLRFLANTLTNKLLHAPTAGLRQAGAEGRSEIVEAARFLLDIDPPDKRRPKP